MRCCWLACVEIEAPGVYVCVCVFMQWHAASRVRYLEYRSFSAPRMSMASGWAVVFDDSGSDAEIQGEEVPAAAAQIGRAQG